MGEALRGLHDEVRRQVGVIDGKPVPPQGVFERVRKRLLEAQHAGMRFRRMLRLVEEDAMESGAPGVEADDGLDELSQQTGKALPPGAFEDLQNLLPLELEFPLCESHHDRVLVGEVLLERTDGDASALGEPARRPCGVAPCLENLSRGIEDRLHRYLGTSLRGPLAGRCRAASGHRVTACGIRVAKLSG